MAQPGIEVPDRRPFNGVERRVSGSGMAAVAAAGAPPAFSVAEQVEDLAVRILRIDGIESQEDGVVFRGRARDAAATTFDSAAEEMRGRGFDASLVETGGGGAALLVRPSAPAAAARSRPLVHVALLAATLLTTTWAGAAHVGVDLSALPARWSVGLPYALALLLILGVHEMGHYVAARLRRVQVTLPYFIPAPFFLGTFGAFIRMKGEIHDRNAFFDIGVAGPLVGLVLAVLAVLVGVSMPAAAVTMHGMRPSSSLLFAGLYMLAGGGDPGRLMALGPIAFAGWLGLVVTALNLIPVGQLDGGHVAYALWGRERSRVVGAVVIGAMLALGVVYSPHWLMWGALVWLIAGTSHPPSRNELLPLSPVRRLLAYATLGLLLIIVLPWPG